MSPLLRGGLAFVGLAGAFTAGFFLRPVPTARTIVAQPPADTHVAAKPSAPAPAPQIDIPDVRPPAPEIKLPDIGPPPIQDPAVKPATVLGSPQAPKPEPVDPLDAAGMAMIRRELGHKTTILDKNEPVPAVLANAGTGPPIPQADLDIPIGPAPMGGPMPRLDPPPMPAIPTITLPPAPPPAVQVPGDVKPPALVNARAVALDFEVTRSGPSKVTDVELWTTRDGGATWAKTDRMAGCVSPFRTRLGSDGEYGFRLVFESESGMRTPEPKPRDQPDLRVRLDTTPPKITDLALSPVEGVPGRVRVRWTMTDDDLDHKASRVEYSTDGRTWLPVASDPNIPHDGKASTSVVWVVPPDVPHRVMIRVTARDKAGNEATAELPRQVSIDLVAPTGKVTGVRRSEAEIGPMPREVAEYWPADEIRTVLSALLSSPVVVVDWGAMRFGRERSNAAIYQEWWCRQYLARLQALVRPNSAKEFVERMTNTTVVEEPALPPFVRRDPFAPPAVSRELPAWVFSHAQRLDVEGLRAICDRPLVPPLERRSAEQLQPFRDTVGYTGGRSLIHHLADPDWTPLTATPDSCRWDPEPNKPRSPFDGIFDLVIPPDRPAAPVVVRGR